MQKVPTYNYSDSDSSLLIAEPLIDKLEKFPKTSEPLKKRFKRINIEPGKNVSPEDLITTNIPITSFDKIEHHPDILSFQIWKKLNMEFIC